MSLVNDFINNLAAAISQKNKDEEERKKKEDAQRQQFSSLEFKKGNENTTRVTPVSDFKSDLLPKTSASSAQMTNTPQSRSAAAKSIEQMNRVATFGQQNVMEMPAVANAAFDTIAKPVSQAGDFVHKLMDKTGISAAGKYLADRPDTGIVGQIGNFTQGKPFTTGQEGDFVKNLAVDFVRSVPRGVQAIKQSEVNQDTFTPKSNLEKFVYGDQPTHSIQKQSTDIQDFEKKYGAPDFVAKGTGLPIAAALTLSDAIPVIPEKHAAQTLAKDALEQFAKKATENGLEKTFIEDTSKRLLPSLTKAFDDIKEATKLKASAPDTVAAEEALSKGTKSKADYDQYIQEVQGWITKKLNEAHAAGSTGIPNDLASVSDKTGAFKSSVNNEAGSLPASTKLEPSQSSITGGSPGDNVTRNTLSSNRTNFVSSFMSKNPSQEEYNTYYRTMQAQEPHYLRQVDQIAQDVGGDATYRLKTPESLSRKMDVRGKSLGEMNDTLAATVTVDHPSAINDALESAKKNLNVVAVDDFRDHPTLFGYRGVHIDHELPNGAIAELQLNTKAGLEGKEWAHDIYTKWRDYIQNNGSTTIDDVRKLIGDNPEKLQEFYKDVQLSRDIYDGKVAVPTKYLETVGKQLSDTRGKIDEAVGRVSGPAALPKEQILADLPLASEKAAQGATDSLPLTTEKAAGGGANDLPPGGSGTTGGNDVVDPNKLTYNEPDGKIYKTEKPNKFQYDVKSLATPEEVKNVILKSAQDAQNSGALQTQRRGTMTETQIRTMADNLGMSYEDVVKRKPGQIFNAEQADAANRLMLDVNEKLFEMSDQIRQLQSAGSAIPEELAAKQLELAARAQGITASVIGDRSEAGRALKAAQMMKDALESSGDARTQLIGEATKMFAGDKKKAEEVIKKIATFDPEDKVGMMKFLRQVKPSSTMEKIEEYWYNSILSNPSTHIFNDIGNTMATMIDVPERAVSGVIDKALSGVTGKTRDRYVAEAAAEVSGVGSGVANGFRRAMKVMAHGISEADVNKLEYGSQAIKGPVGNVINIPSRALVAQDEFFKGINYEMELRAQALRLAKQEGKTGEEFTKRYAELLAEPTGQMQQSAIDAAKIRLFQGDSLSANAVRYFRDNLFKFSAGPLGDIRPVKFVIPFVQTPINVLKFGLERSPAGFLAATGKAIGGASKGEVADSLARAFIGSAVMVPLAMYATQDKITGAAPKDNKMKDAFYAEGKLPFSVKIGNNWVAYNRVEPLNTLLSQIAMWHDASKNNNHIVSLATLTDFLRGEASNFTSQTFMTGLGNLVNAMEDPKRYGEKFATDIIGGFIPSFVGAGARAADDTIRQPKTVQDSLLARLPLLSKNVPAQENSFEPGGTGVRHTNDGVVRNIASNVLGFRTSPDTGRDILPALESIKNLRASAKADSEKDTQAADTIFSELKTADDPQKVIESHIKDGTLNKNVLTKLKDNIKQAAMPPLLDEEKTLKSAPNKVRAGYMMQKLDGMDPDAQSKWIGEMIQKKVVTGDVMKEYIKLKQEQDLGKLPLTPTP